jgi:predicted nucleic acid-binding protein
MRIFLDANVLFSAAKQPGVMAQLLQECLNRSHTLVVDGYVLAEAEKNLDAKFPEGLANLSTLRAECVFVQSPRTQVFFPDILPLLPEKDVPVLLSAIESDCDVLVTGDKKHFGLLYNQLIHGVLILSPAMLALKL